MRLAYIVFPSIIAPRTCDERAAQHDEVLYIFHIHKVRVTFLYKDAAFLRLEPKLAGHAPNVRIHNRALGAYELLFTIL